MNRSELVDSIALKSGLSKADSKKALTAFIESVEDCIESGERVQLVGFGSFSVDLRNARMARNPQTGEAMRIPAKKVVKFKAGAYPQNAANQVYPRKSAPPVRKMKKIEDQPKRKRKSTRLRDLL